VLAIQTKDLVKRYRIGIGRARVREMLPSPVDTLVARLAPTWWTRDTFNALDGISLEIEAGASVGIVGHNGAGKTTLLKVLSGVTEPTSGSMRVSGHVGALIDVLVGFHPELTGRENVYMFGAMLGFNRKQMAGRIDRVLDFAEITGLADTPVKRYSAGMISRIGFATVAALDVDVLLVDEVLAVGDANFQKKCINWLETFRDDGGTLLFVSHNLGLVRSMTDHVVWLDHGKLVSEGPTADVLTEYGRAMERRDMSGQDVAARGRIRRMLVSRGQLRYGAGGARVEEVHVGQPDPADHALEISVAYSGTEIQRAIFCVGFVDEAGREVGAATSPLLPLDVGGGQIGCTFRPLPLRTGVYFPVVAILSEDGLVRDRWRLDRAVAIDANGELALSEEFGPVHLTASWAENDEMDPDVGRAVGSDD
jgi:ABC-type polysaccharide/polyol phosphate transport system ATPase subunit